ncbi:hypothetical protein C8J43_10412 [Sphingomonas sp. PP-CE-1G-424]|nr:hypothetical protein C8J43_10412 [Sphingomonas sp. PP-CE-1G-424]
MISRQLRPSRRRLEIAALRALFLGAFLIKACNLLTVPNQLGVDYNAHVLESVLTYVAPALGWR